MELAGPSGGRRKLSPAAEGRMVKTSFSNTGQLGLAYIRHIAAVEITGARDNFGGLGAMLTTLAHFLELSSVRVPGAAWDELRAPLRTARPGIESIYCSVKMRWTGSIAEGSASALPISLPNSLIGRQRRTRQYPARLTIETHRRNGPRVGNCGGATNEIQNAERAVEVDRRTQARTIALQKRT